MGQLEDRRYHEVRANAELELALEASDSATAAIHRELAALHRRKMMSIADDEVALGMNGRLTG